VVIADKKNERQWVETNPSNIRIFTTDICFLRPHGTTLKALIRMLIRMFADVRLVGFLPPDEKTANPFISSQT
jgi:hypothetical protein